MDIPPRIDGAQVVCFTKLDERHLATGACRHIVSGELMEHFAGLAICKYEDDSGYYLFYCDADWNTITDTYHESLENAMHQAEFEFKGVGETWRKAG